MLYRAGCARIKRSKMKFSREVIQNIIREAIKSAVNEEITGDVQSDEEAYAMINSAMQDIDGGKLDDAHIKLQSIAVYYDEKLAGGEGPEWMRGSSEVGELEEATIQGCEEADEAFKKLANAQSNPQAAEEAAREWLGVLQRCADEGRIAPTLLQLLLRGRKYRPGSETSQAPSTDIVGHDPRKPVTIPHGGRVKSVSEEENNE